MTEEHLGTFLLQVLLLLTLARGFGEVLRRFGHPPLVGEIAIGLLLGPTLLGRAWPALQVAIFPSDPIQQAMLDTVSWFGVLFLLLETGLEVDLSAAWRQRKTALRIGVIGVLVPLAVGFGLSMLLPDRYLPDPGVRVVFALFLGTTIAISALVIIARVLQDLDLVKSDLGLVTLSGYAVNDVLAWVILSIVIGLATPLSVSVGNVAFVLVFSVAFTALCLTVGVRLVGHSIEYLSDQLPEQPGAVLTLVSCVGLACGVATHAAGLTALLGFFLAGIMAGEARALSERTRHVVSQMVHAIFVPLYFASIGLRYDFLVEFDWFIVTFVTVISIGAKFGGAWLGALGTELSKEDRLSIGIAFTPKRCHRDRRRRPGAGVRNPDHSRFRGHRSVRDRFLARGRALAIVVDPATEGPERPGVVCPLGHRAQPRGRDPVGGHRRDVRTTREKRATVDRGHVRGCGPGS